MITFILIASLLLQLLAIYFALRLIRPTGRRFAWILIASAIALMALRRGISLSDILVSGKAAPGDLVVELVALLISALLAAGIAYMTPIFKGIRSIAERLRRQKQFSDEVINSLPGVFYVLDREGGMLRVNSNFIEVSGYSHNEIKGMNALDFVAEDERERMTGEIRKGFELGDISVELEFVTKTGEKIPYSFTGHRVDIGDATYLIGVGSDISERKQQELQLRKFASIVASTDDAVISKSLTGIIESWNRGAERLFGYTEKEAIGRPIQMLMLDEQHDEEAAVLARIARGEGMLQYETVRRHKDGHLIDIATTISPIFDDNGVVVGAAKIARDISERKLAEKKIDQLNRNLEARVVERTAKLEAANKDLEGFSYSISHDLRSPLRAISGFSEILIEEYAGHLDAEGKRLLNVVSDNAQKMGELIDDILAFSRAGRNEIAYATIDMGKMVAGVWSELEPEAGERDVHLDFGEIPSAQGDSAAIRQVVLNLLSNALKFTQHRTEARIEVGGYVDGGESIYFVKDNGAGFDMEYAPMLFGVFRRLHGADEFEGSGIGLAIVKRIVTKHGGRVWAQGKPDEGATFYFSLPVKEKADG